MQDHIKVAIFAVLSVVLLCLVQSGHGQEDDQEYSKRSSRQGIRSAQFDSDAISAFLKNTALARSRVYRNDPDQMAKRQHGHMTNLVPGVGVLSASIQSLQRELQYYERAMANQQRFLEGGKK